MSLALIIAGLAAAGAILLWTPIKFRVVLSGEERRLMIRYLGFGHTTDFLAGTRRVDWLGLQLSRRTISRVATPVPKPSPRPTPKRKPGRVQMEVRILWRHRGTIGRAARRLLRYLARLLASPQLRRARLDVVAGADNPAITGMCYGWYQVWQSAPRSPRIAVHWQPVFHRPCFSARVDGEAWLFPIQPVKHTIRLVRELPKRALYRLYKDWKRQEA